MEDKCPNCGSEAEPLGAGFCDDCSFQCGRCEKIFPHEDAALEEMAVPRCETCAREERRMSRDEESLPHIHR